MLRIITKIFCALSVLVAVASLQPAFAQTGEPWKRVCQDDTKIESCRIAQQLYLNKNVDGKKQTVGRVLSLTVLYLFVPQTGQRQPFMSIIMPLGVDLRAGAKIKVDEGQEIPLRFLQCTKAGCAASVGLDTKLLEAMKAGNRLRVAFRPWGSKETAVLNASLKGFTKGVNSLK
ncbi:MAG: invasion associated locus B family protein [Sneathiellales bacterium]|nr:invasion associated locus B family protein [Sneathiellales bacterium]